MSSPRPSWRGQLATALARREPGQENAILANVGLIVSGASEYPRSIEMSTLIQAEIPDQLAQQAQRMVERGWAASVESLVAESLRRYLDSHQEDLTEQFIREDVEWG